jgi:hypothetical protein
MLQVGKTVWCGAEENKIKVISSDIHEKKGATDTITSIELPAPEATIVKSLLLVYHADTNQQEVWVMRILDNGRRSYIYVYRGEVLSPVGFTS